jgi:hypothetical protein
MPNYYSVGEANMSGIHCIEDKGTVDARNRKVGTLHVTIDGTVKGTSVFTTAAPTTSATLVLAANTSRKTATIYNNGSVTVYLGKDATVTTANGLPLPVGATLEDDSTTSAWYGITASGTGDLRIVEVA